MQLDANAARAGIQQKCAVRLGLDVIEAANGIVEIANAAMVNALRITKVRRGYDPRHLVMLAFGGAGPLHANRICAEMQIPLLIIPPSPGTTSALGLLATDVKHEFSRTRVTKAASVDIHELNRIFSAMSTKVTSFCSVKGSRRRISASSMRSR